MTPLESLWKRGKDFLGVKTPIMAGAMTWISDSAFTAEVSNHGAFGCLAGGNMDPGKLEDEIRLTKERTTRPFAVNLITIAPNYPGQLKAVRRNAVPFVIFAGSFPREAEIREAKDSGAKVLCFASSDIMAKRLISQGTDALILEGSEAGGHVGHVSLGILLQQVLFRVEEVPVFVAGGIATGAFIAHLLLMGAAGVQLGTFFVLTEECRAHPNFKRALIRAQARAAVSTPQIGSELKVVAVRALRNKGHDRFADLQMDLIRQRREGAISQAEAQAQVEGYWVGALRRAVEDGDMDYGSVMAGQSAGLVDRVRPLGQALAYLKEGAEQEIERVRRRVTAL